MNLMNDKSKMIRSIRSIFVFFSSSFFSLWNVIKQTLLTAFHPRIAHEIPIERYQFIQSNCSVRPSYGFTKNIYTYCDQMKPAARQCSSLTFIHKKRAHARTLTHNRQLAICLDRIHECKQNGQRMKQCGTHKSCKCNSVSFFLSRENKERHTPESETIKLATPRKYRATLMPNAQMNAFGAWDLHAS